MFRLESPVGVAGGVVTIGIRGADTVVGGEEAVVVRSGALVVLADVVSGAVVVVATVAGVSGFPLGSVDVDVDPILSVVVVTGVGGAVGRCLRSTGSSVIGLQPSSTS